MSVAASWVLRYGVAVGVGMVAAQLIAVGGVLVADWWAVRCRR
jgi:hypothetical protein